MRIENNGGLLNKWFMDTKINWASVYNNNNNSLGGRQFWKLEIKVQKYGDWKRMEVFSMIYGHNKIN